MRAAKRERLLAAGTEVYPVQVPRTRSLADVTADPAYAALEDGQETDDVVSVTGRVMFVRGTGRLAFATLQEGDARLQVMLSLAEVGDERARGVEARRRPGRPGLGDRPRGEQPPRRAVGHGHLVGDGVQGAAAPADAAQGAGRGHPGPPPLRRPARAARGPRHGPHQGDRAALPARDLPPPRLPRGGDARPAAAARRRHRAPLPHPPQRARRRDEPADRHRAVPQALHRRRAGQGLRDRPDLPQRGHRLHAQPRVHDAGGVRGLRRLRLRGRAGADPHRGRGAGHRAHRRCRTAAAARSTSPARGARPPCTPRCPRRWARR